MLEFLSRPWPWYVAGPLIGLMVPLLLIFGNRPFGISSNLRHLCAVVCPAEIEHFRYDWRKSGLWNLVFLLGVFLGAVIAHELLAGPPPAVSAETRTALATLGITEITGLAPASVFSWSALLTLRGFVSVVVGGFLVGFGSAYAGGCTSGHAISGLANLEKASLLAVVGFFAGGLLTTFVILPLVL